MPAHAEAVTVGRQLTPGTANAVIIACDAPDASAIDLEAAMASLRPRADAWDESFFGTRGYSSRRSFCDVFLRLDATIAWYPRCSGLARAAAWVNPSARTPVEQRALAAIVDALRAGE